MGAALSGAEAAAPELLIQNPIARAAIPAATADPITSPTTRPGKTPALDVVVKLTRLGGLVPPPSPVEVPTEVVEPTTPPLLLLLLVMEVV